jgi:hypothetical protein
MRISLIGAVVSALLVTGCALPPHAALPPGARDQIAGTDVMVPIRQHEIYVYVPPTQNPNGGLIGALVASAIDDVRSGKAETAVKPLRNALVDYDFDGTLKSELQTALAKDTFLGQNNIRIIKEITTESLEQALNGSKAPAVLFVTADYRLSNEGDVLDVLLYPQLFGTTDALRTLVPKYNAKNRMDPANTLYRNVLLFQTRIPEDPNGRDAHVQTWSANNGEKARAALKLAENKLAVMLAQDIAMSEAEGKAAFDAGTPVGNVFFDGRIIATDEEGSIIRNAEGGLIYATKAMLQTAK